MDKKEAVVEAEEKEIGSDDVRYYIGINFSCTDGGDATPPESHALDSSNVSAWFEKYPEHLQNPELQVLGTELAPGVVKNGFDIPYLRKTIDLAIWGSEVYTSWSKLKPGGCFALLDFPVRMVLQTPNDGFPFVSLAMSRKGIICKGILAYDNPVFEPIQMMQGETLFSGWRSNGIQILSLPKAILKAHSAWLSDAMSNVLARLQCVEEVLASPYVTNFADLQRELHSCKDTMLRLERRSEWEAVVISAIDSAAAGLNSRGSGPEHTLASAKAQIQMRRSDFETFPRRIESARMAVNDHILQQTQAQSLQIAHATQRIAEATMHDSASMKTIAVLAMVFLPGTAVASFFSMTMWNWDADSGSSLVSPWLWIYFVVAAPMTFGVIAFWYFWTEAKSRELSESLPTMMTQPAPHSSGTKGSIDIKKTD